MLSDPERQCFARVAVFAGGATVHAAETIIHAGLDTLDGLVAKSLLVGARKGYAVSRLSMLETVRAYATERFDADADADAIREGHYRYYLALVERHGTERALWGSQRREHLALLDAEIENLHVAFAGGRPAKCRTRACDVGRAPLLLDNASRIRRRGGLG